MTKFHRATITVLILAFGFCANALEPKDPVAACSRISNYSLRDACTTMVISEQTDWLAAAACDRISSAKLTVACMAMIAGQYYSQSQILYCDSYTYARPTVACFAQVNGATNLKSISNLDSDKR